MGRTCLFVITMCLASPSFGQASRTSYGLSDGSVSRAGDAYQLGARVAAHWGSDRGSDTGDAPKECLDHKKTGKTICLTREEWTAVATGKRKKPY